MVTLSFGNILWELVTRKILFGDIKFNLQVEELIISGARPDIPDTCLPQVKELIL